MRKLTMTSVLLVSFVTLTACGQGNSDAQSAETETISFYLRLPDDIVSLTHGGDVGLKRSPQDIAMLPSRELGKSLAMTGILRDETGTPVGTGAELEYFPDGQAPGVTWEVYWTVFVPGRGSIYGYEQEAVPPEHFEIFEHVAGGSDWSGPGIVGRVAAGPRSDGFGVILGGDGEFANAKGAMAEFAELTGLTTDGELSGTMELRFILEK